MANTISPPSRQLALTRQSSLVGTVSQFYDDALFPVLLCPPALFLEIIRINDLRARAADLRGPKLLSLRHEACSILRRVLAFSPPLWADMQRGASTDDDGHSAEWLLLGRIYRSAIALYCVASLQSLSVLPYSADYGAMRSGHRVSLLSSLDWALSSPVIKMWMMWPLVVAGLEAAGISKGSGNGSGGGANTRTFVSRELGKMARDAGTPLPLVAREMLEAFWRRGGREWDGCFDRPFAFVL